MPLKVVDPVLPDESSQKPAGWFQVQLGKGRQSIAYVLGQVWIFTLILKHPRAPWASRVVAGLSMSYLLSPIQLIPTVIPVIGQLDDLFVIWLGMKIARKLTPDEVMKECTAKAGSSEVLQRVHGTSAVAAEPKGIPAA